MSRFSTKVMVSCGGTGISWETDINTLQDIKGNRGKTEITQDPLTHWQLRRKSRNTTVIRWPEDTDKTSCLQVWPSCCALLILLPDVHPCLTQAKLIFAARASTCSLKRREERWLNKPYSQGEWLSIVIGAFDISNCHQVFLDVLFSFSEVAKSNPSLLQCLCNHKPVEKGRNFG